MAAYARQAKNRDLEADAIEIRMRATRRLDQMRVAQKETVGLARGTRGQLAGGLKINPPENDKPTLLRRASTRISPTKRVSWALCRKSNSSRL